MELNIHMRSEIEADSGRVNHKRKVIQTERESLNRESLWNGGK